MQAIRDESQEREERSDFGRNRFFFFFFSNQKPISEIGFGEDRDIPCDLNVVTIINVNEENGLEYYLTQK